MAINFPATTSQPTDGSFTHTASGITWAWDGTTWNAQGVTGQYTLPVATSTTLGGIKVGSNLSISNGVLSTQGIALSAQLRAGANGSASGTISNVAAISFDSNANFSITDKGSGEVFVTGGAGGSALTIADEGTDLSTAATKLDFVGAGVTASGNGATKTITINTGSGGSSLQSRTSANAATASIASGAAGDITIVAAKTYALLSVQTSAAAWVTLYTDTTSRTNDASRTELEDPTAGSGVIAEVITSGAATQIMSPATFGFNLDATPSTNVYAKVVNKSASTASITVTLTYLQLED